MRKIAKWLAKVIEPHLKAFTKYYGIEMRKHYFKHGQNELIIEDSFDEARRHIPRSTYFNTRSGSIKVGENTVFCQYVSILTGKHYNTQEAALSGQPLHYVPTSGRDITIGQGCFFGHGVIVVGSVTIGDYAVIGAGSVVTKDVPSRTFVAGIPAKVIRRLE